MTLYPRFIVLAVVATVTLFSSSDAADPALKIRPVKAEVSGRGFEIRVLRKGAPAFKSRAYTWSDLPEDIDGLRYTQTQGGGTATIRLKALERGSVFVAVAANQMLDMQEKGWNLPMPNRLNTFTYSDAAQSLMMVLSHEVKQGEEIDIPQVGWPGTIVLLPSDSKRKETKPLTL